MLLEMQQVKVSCAVVVSAGIKVGLSKKAEADQDTLLRLGGFIVLKVSDHDRSSNESHLNIHQQIPPSDTC